MVLDGIVVSCVGIKITRSVVAITPVTTVGRCAEEESVVIAFPVIGKAFCPTKEDVAVSRGILKRSGVDAITSFDHCYGSGHSDGIGAVTVIDHCYGRISREIPRASTIVTVDVQIRLVGHIDRRTGKVVGNSNGFSSPECTAIVCHGHCTVHRTIVIDESPTLISSGSQERTALRYSYTHIVVTQVGTLYREGVIRTAVTDGQSLGRDINRGTRFDIDFQIIDIQVVHIGI